VARSAAVVVVSDPRSIGKGRPGPLPPAVRTDSCQPFALRRAAPVPAL